jgi:hypothetical protein
MMAGLPSRRSEASVAPNGHAVKARGGLDVFAGTQAAVAADRIDWLYAHGRSIFIWSYAVTFPNAH